MATFVPFNGKGLIRFNSVGDGYQCNFCVKSFKTFDLYETHWPKCTGICKERAFRAFDAPPYLQFPSSFNVSNTTDKKAAKKTGTESQTPKNTTTTTAASSNSSSSSSNQTAKNTASGTGNSKNNGTASAGTNKGKGKNKKK
ncbi:hypothetical protein IW140_005135 [Coemansia sp. RSA 1813]|nr:hypothetical protein IW138_004523 [Coemansia sp. RSA 986]KAJ2211966.1 hypothetical protein EV179_005073 [Coemansia sp. RSA 487]KAJ2565853.1 hypothetical protein IW140_005135 [Coemansia sp. RSA 1813]